MGGGGALTPIYWLYVYVPLERVWFSRAVWSGIGSSNHRKNWSSIGSCLKGSLTKD